MIKRVEFEIYKNGIKCKIDDGRQKKEGVFAKRDDITIFSKKSKNRLAWVYSQGPWVSMLTLTYHVDFPAAEVSKKHMNTFLSALHYFKIKYLWVLEFQGRGYPHYHVWMSKTMKKDEWQYFMKIWLKSTIEFNGSDKAIKFHLHDKGYKAKLCIG